MIKVPRRLNVVVVGQQQDGDAGVMELLHDLGRARLLVADDEAGSCASTGSADRNR